MLARIGENIARRGCHVYMISADSTPRYAYTIGLSEVARGAEYVFAGGAVYADAEVKRIIDAAAQAHPSAGQSLVVSGLGSFALRALDPSWAELLLLGAHDYYRRSDVSALQLVPDLAHTTIDVPDLSQPFAEEEPPVWRWLSEPWPHPVPAASVGITELAVLRGEAVTEVVRWERNEWELFAGAGPKVSPEDIRKVPLGTLLAADASLSPILDLELGVGLWREQGDAEWQPWRAKG